MTGGKPFQQEVIGGVDDRSGSEGAEPPATKTEASAPAWPPVKPNLEFVSRALWRAVGGDQPGFPDHRCLGARDAQAGGFEIRPGLLRAVTADRADVEPVALGQGLRNAGFDLRSKTGKNGEDSGN